MRAYSMDLRERVLLDSDAGMKVGEVAPRVQRHGRRCMLEPHLHTLADLITAHPDRTLAELKDALATPASERWPLSAGQLIDIVKWNLLRHIPVKMRGGRR